MTDVIPKLNSLTVREEFPIFHEYPNLIYLDNGATTHKPISMIKALSEYYIKLNSNVGRGSYSLANLSDHAYSFSKQTIAKFFNTSTENTIYTSGATESSNMAINLIEQVIPKTGKIVTTVLEHHSNFLPLQNLAKKLNLEFVVIDDLDIISQPEILPISFWNDVRIFSCTHVSNTTGRILPIEQWVKIAKQHGAITIIDGSQAVSSQTVDISTIGSDFYYFSAHKMYGPMGFGILFISDQFKNLFPYKLGGGIVDYVTKKDFTLSEGIHHFEAGTPNVANAYAFASSLEFLKNTYFLVDNQHKLADYAFNKLKTIETKNYKIQILDQQDRELNPNKFSSLMSFVVLNKNPNERGLHSHDIGNYLTECDICVRFGQHCAHPLHEEYNISSSIRLSLGIYNTQEDIDIFLKTLHDGLVKFDSI